MAVTWQQWVNGFNSTVVGTGCTVTIDSAAAVPDKNKLTATIASATDGSDEAIAKVTTNLPAGNEGRIRFKFATPATFDLLNNSTPLVVSNAAGEMFELFIDSAQVLHIFTVVGPLGQNGGSVSTGQTLAANTEYTIEIAWRRNAYWKVWLNETLVASDLTLSGATGTDAITTEIDLGIHHYDGTDTNGWTAVYRWAQVGDNADTALVDPSAGSGFNRIVYTTVYGANQQVYYTVENDAYYDLFLRYDETTDTGYLAEYESDTHNINIYKCTGRNAFTILGLAGNTGRALVVGDQLGFDATGNVLTAYLNGVALPTTFTDATYNRSGKIGLGLSSGKSLDGFGGGSTGITMLVGKIPSSSTVRGVSLSTGGVTLSLGKIPSGAAVRGVSLSQALLVGKIPSSAAVRGVSLTSSVAYVPQPNPWAGVEVVGPFIDTLQSALAQISLVVAQLHISNGSNVYSDTGVPSNTVGADGDYYFRKDGTAGAHLYFKVAGAWAAIA